MTPFTTCSAGHDLTKPGAYLYRSSGNRECRACSTIATPRRTSRGAFNRSDPPKQRIGTWAEKYNKTRDTYA